ncbi:uncharacterized protein MELLADRAFT_31252, partial [Melampsora larici-populina 98AG31]
LMFVLGVNLPERKLVQFALLQYVGIGHYTAKLICNRLQFHPKLTVDFKLSDPPKPKTLSLEADPLQRLIIESDLRREVRANIAHHRAVGSYRGKRHALGFPVNGQRTHTNAKTAKKLNRVDR